MAGDIKRQRKSWTLQDRSKVSINILRANLAEEGDEDAQLDLAKRLLHESSDNDAPEKSRRENARLALYWLIKSSEQGNEEATKLLKDCLQTGSGLTAQNILDVKTCITTPKHEKLTFKAARLLYRKLSNGEEFITTAQLLARLRALKEVTHAYEHRSNGIVEQEETIQEENAADVLREEQQQNASVESKENSTNSSSPLAKDSLKNLVDLNETFVVPNNTKNRFSTTFKKSHSPTSQQQDLNGSLEDHQRNTLADEFPVLDLQFAMLQSGKKLTVNDLFNVAKDLNIGRAPEISIDERNKIRSRHKWNVNSSPNTFIVQLLILAVMGNVIHATNAIPYLIFLGMIWSCYNCFVCRMRYRNFMDWQLAFQSVITDEWKTDKLLMRLSTRYLLPHVIMLSLGPLLLCVLIENQQPDLLVMFGTVVVLAIQFGLRQKYVPCLQHLLVLLLAVGNYQHPLIATVFGESMNEYTNLLQQDISRVTGPNPMSTLAAVNIFSLLVFTILCTCVKFSVNKFVNETVPDIIVSFWIIKVVQTSSSIELSSASVDVFLALMVCATMMLLCSQIKCWKLVLIFACIACATITGIVAKNQSSFLSLPSTVEYEDDQVRFLEWEEYDVSCHRKAWNVQSVAATQIKCSTKFGDDPNVLVKWKGRISVVKVEELSRSAINPKTIDNVIFEISVAIFSSHKEDGSRNWQNFLSGSRETDIVAPATVTVSTASVHGPKQKQDLINHILNFKTGDRIEFVGKLKGSTAGSLKPHIVDVQSIHCISCAAADYGEWRIRQNYANFFSLDWVKRVITGIPTKVKDSDILENSKRYITDFISRIRNMLG